PRASNDGPRSIEHVCSVPARVKTLVWNGPFGAFELEPFDIGTVEVAEAAAELTAAGKIITVAGGGDTVAALNAAGATGRFTYVATARSSNGWRANPCRGSRRSGSDNGGLSTCSSRWTVGQEEGAPKSSSARSLSKDYPILQVAVYARIESANKIIESLTL